MAVPKSTTGMPWVQTISVPLRGATAATSIPAAATTEAILFTHDRALRFREIKVMSQQSVVSGHPQTNYMVAEIWNFSDATKIATATITNISNGTALRRGVFVSIATTNQFLTANGAALGSNKTVTVKFVGTNSLSNGLIAPVVQIFADIRD